MSKKFSKRMKKYVIALALLLMAIAVVIIAIMVKKAPPSNVKDALGRPPLWNTLYIYQQYDQLKTKTGALFTANEIVPSADTVSDHLYDTEAFGYDSSKKEHRLAVKVHRMKGYSEEAVLAAQYAGNSSFYLFKNTEYAPRTFGQLVADLNLQNTAVIREAQSKDERGKPVQHAITDTAACWALLQECADAPCAENAQAPADEIIIFFTLDMLFAPEVGTPCFAVSPTGSLTTNVFGSLYTFEIGTAQAEKMIEALITE